MHYEKLQQMLQARTRVTKIDDARSEDKQDTVNDDDFPQVHG